MRAALLAPDENIFGAHDAILVADGLDLAFLFTKPGHMNLEVKIETAALRLKLPMCSGLKKGNTEFAVY